MSSWYDPNQLDEYINQFESKKLNLDQEEADEFSLGDDEENNNNKKEEEEEDLGIVSYQNDIDDDDPSSFSNKKKSENPHYEISTPHKEEIATEENILKIKSIQEEEETQQKQLTKEQLNSSSLSSSQQHHHHKKSPSISSSSSLSKYRAGFSLEKTQVKFVDSPADKVNVRTGPNYSIKGLKIPSDSSLYEIFALDILRGGKKKVSHLATQIAFPYAIPSIHGLPGILIINIQMPNKGPALFRSSSSDTDTGTSLVFYFKLKQNLTLCPAIELACKFFSGEIKGRFKAITFVDNLRELKFPSLIAKPMNTMNGKPVIIFKTGQFYGNLEVFEIDIDVFQFPATVRTALNMTKSMASQALLRAAFVIQGETDSELPERLLGCCSITGLDLDKFAFENFGG